MKSRRFRSQPQLIQAESNAPALRVGAKGAGVAAVQTFLRDIGFAMPVTFAGKKADGIYGAETEKFVREFQKSHGLAADGVVGRDTIARMDQTLVEKPFLDTGDHAEYAADMRADVGKPLHQRRTYHA